MKEKKSNMAAYLIALLVMDLKNRFPADEMATSSMEKYASSSGARFKSPSLAVATPATETRTVMMLNHMVLL